MIPAQPTEFVRYVLELLAPMGEVRARSMFGGYGVYRGDIFFAIVVEDRLYFKTDRAAARKYAAMGLGPFVYVARGKTIALQYHEAPPEVFESSAAMRSCALEAIQVAQHAGTGKGRRVT